MMKAHDLRQLSDAELQKRIQEEEENISHLKFQKVIGQLENPMKLGHVHKEIARMKTILRDRQLKPIEKEFVQPELVGKEIISEKDNSQVA